MKLEEKIREAAFWERWVCVTCGFQGDDEEAVYEGCECDGTCPVPGIPLRDMLDTIAEDQANSEEG